MSSDKANEVKKPQACSSSPIDTRIERETSQAMSQLSRTSITSTDNRVSGATSGAGTGLSMQRWLQEAPADGPWFAASRFGNKASAHAAPSDKDNVNQGGNRKDGINEGKLHGIPNSVSK